MTTDIPAVKDLVIPIERYPHVNQDKTLHDAVQVIQSYTCGENDRIRYSEIMVVNDQNQLAGRLSILDVLRGLDKRFSEIPKVKEFAGKGSDYPNLTILWEDAFFVGCAKGVSRPVREFMSPIKNMVKTSDSLLKVLSILLSLNCQLLPVVEGKRVVGVIRLEEIFKEISVRCGL
ncbi:MAG: CBS domain-containing protein [Desulfobulbaceae bacterium]|nr:CBS domain-containing protein [Desulfobulbaceae bacterium]